jgi:serine/threonine-protein kinase RsbW
MGSSSTVKEIKVDENSVLFEKTGMLHKEFPSDFRQIRYFTLLIVQSAPPDIKEINLLEQQISEIIKNAVKHGNKCETEKRVRVWYSFSPEHAHLIVEDEGSGFQDIAKWNEFNRKRQSLLEGQDYEALADYVSYKGAVADENDGGNALFAALEYWDGGLVFNHKRNCVAVLKRFPKKRRGVAVEG